MSVIIIIALLTVYALGQIISINTNLAATLEVQGYYWDIEALSDITLTGFIIDIENCPNNLPFQVQIYKLNTMDTYMGSENNPDAWTLIERQTIMANVCFIFIMDSPCLPLSLPPNSKQGFFLYITPQDPNNTSDIIAPVVSVTDNEGDIVATDGGNINILSGTIIEKFGNEFNRTTNTSNGFEPALIVFFNTDTINPTVNPTNTPTITPTNIPSNTPSNMPSITPLNMPSMMPTKSLGPSKLSLKNKNEIERLEQRLKDLQRDLKKCKCNNNKNKYKSSSFRQLSRFNKYKYNDGSSRKISRFDKSRYKPNNYNTNSFFSDDDSEY